MAPQRGNKPTAQKRTKESMNTEAKNPTEAAEIGTTAEGASNPTAQPTAAPLMSRAEYMATPPHVEAMNKEDRQAYRREMHRRYYGQLVCPAIVYRVKTFITLPRLLDSTDEHLNDVPLSLWDRHAEPCPAELARRIRETGDYPTLSHIVCTMKEAARQLIEEARAGMILNLDDLTRSRYFEAFESSKTGNDLFINDPERADRMQAAAEFGADGSTHAERLQDMTEANDAAHADRVYISQFLAVGYDEDTAEERADALRDKIAAEIAECEKWHEANGTLFNEIG